MVLHSCDTHCSPVFFLNLVKIMGKKTGVPRWLRRLRIQHCHCCGMGYIPGWKVLPATKMMMMMMVVVVVVGRNKHTTIIVSAVEL